jgi:hypothetical protein
VPYSLPIFQRASYEAGGGGFDALLKLSKGNNGIDDTNESAPMSKISHHADKMPDLSLVEAAADASSPRSEVEEAEVSGHHHRAAEGENGGEDNADDQKENEQNKNKAAGGKVSQSVCDRISHYLRQQRTQKKKTTILQNRTKSGVDPTKNECRRRQIRFQFGCGPFADFADCTDSS